MRQIQHLWLYSLLIFLLMSCATILNRELADHYYNIATDYYTKKEYNEAVSYYKLALEQNPNLSQALLNYGLSLIETKDYSNAKKQLQKAYKLDIRNTLCLSALGYLEFEEGNYHDAVEWFQRSIDINGYNPDTYFNLGVTEQYAENYQASQKAFEEVRRLQDPKSLPAKLRLYEAFNYLVLKDEGRFRNLYAESFAGDEQAGVEAFEMVYKHYIQLRNYQDLGDIFTLFTNIAGDNPTVSFLQAELYYIYLKDAKLGQQSLEAAINLGYSDTERIKDFLAKLTPAERKLASTIVKLPQDPQDP